MTAASEDLESRSAASTAHATSNESPRFGGLSSSIERVQRRIPPFDEISFWLIVNTVLFIYVGWFELVNGTGPILYMAGGQYLSGGAVILGIVYLLMWMWRKSHRTTADFLIMMLSGLAVLGDLIFLAWPLFGSFTGDSAILDVVGLLLLRSAYQEYRSPA